jgi:CRP-like cAMP-binding protein
MMFMQEVELFRRIPSYVIDEIAGIATEESFPEGYQLFRQGDLADFLYILQEGEINISIEKGEQFSFLMNQSGSVFGWSALIEPNWYTATAKCIKKSDVIKIDADRLMRVFEKHPAEGLTIMRRLAGIVATRLVKAYQELSVFLS